MEQLNILKYLWLVIGIVLSFMNQNELGLGAIAIGVMALCTQEIIKAIENKSKIEENKE